MRFRPGSDKYQVMETALTEPALIEYGNAQAPLGDRHYFYLVRDRARRNGNRSFDQLTFHPVDTILLIGTKDALRSLKKRGADWLRQNL